MHHQLNFPVFLAVWNKLQGQTTPRIHYHIATWLYRAWEDGNRRLLLMAFRSCGKSTLVGLFCVWLLWRDPNLRILVIAADAALARKMVRQVKRIIEKHPFTSALKPTAADQWASDRFTLNRQAEWRDPSMLAKGISSNLTGTRADIIICDDVEVPKTSDTDSKRADLRDRLMELDYILTPHGTQIYIGTPHHYETIYQTQGDDAFLINFMSLKVPIINDRGQSQWPERFPMDMINALKLKSGPYHFQSQMMLEPQNINEGRFDANAIHIYDGDIEYTESNHTAQLSINGIKMAYAVAWWDPAFAAHGRVSDQSILAILFADHDGRFYLHHVAMIAARTQDVDDEATQQCRQVAQWLKQFHVPHVAVETNGLGKFLPSILRREIVKTRAGAFVQEITSRKAKSLRILESFDVVLAARALFVHRSVLQTDFRRQLKDWTPTATSTRDDILDAVAGALSLHPVRIAQGKNTGLSRPYWMNGGSHAIKTDPFKI